MANETNRNMFLSSFDSLYYVEECSIIDQWKCKVQSKLQSKKIIYNETKAKLLDRLNLKIENAVCYVNLFKSKIVKKGSDGIEDTIDAFEEFVSNVKLKTQYFTAKDCIENYVNDYAEHLQDKFECAFDRWKIYMHDCREQISCKINSEKEYLVDDFEEMFDSVKDISKPPKIFSDLKEEVIDMFDIVVERCNDFIISTEDRIRYITEKQREDIDNEFENIVDDMKEKIEDVNFLLNNQKEMITDIVDDTGYAIENMRCMLKAKKSEYQFNAECAFDEVVDSTKQIVSEAKQSAKIELNHLDYIVLLTEFFLKDFVCFSEELIDDFASFSERQVDYYLSIGSRKLQELYSLHYRNSLDNPQ